ncbi:uncharacterized protein LOC142771276 isoform X2 [Rhipicephalus microplus]|uniref:uncharacterized protein LOC142771276 isoform X2 n=1 Tax=Rhipicephalus microplus TaxID=6941 RepID=UPI003F6D1BF2
MNIRASSLLPVILLFALTEALVPEERLQGASRVLEKARWFANMLAPTTNGAHRLFRRLGLPSFLGGGGGGGGPSRRRGPKGRRTGMICRRDSNCGNREAYCCVANGHNDKVGLCQDKPLFRQTCSPDTNLKGLHLYACPCQRGYTCFISSSTAQTGTCILQP